MDMFWRSGHLPGRTPRVCPNNGPKKGRTYINKKQGGKVSGRRAYTSLREKKNGGKEGTQKNQPRTVEEEKCSRAKKGQQALGFKNKKSWLRPERGFTLFKNLGKKRKKPRARRWN